MSKWIDCPVCNGSGRCVRCGGKSDTEVLKNCCKNGKCSYCNGSGKVQEKD